MDSQKLWMQQKTNLQMSPLSTYHKKKIQFEETRSELTWRRYNNFSVKCTNKLFSNKRSFIIPRATL